MQKKFLILFLIIFISNCVSKKQSVGDFNEIVIVSSHVDKELVYPYISSIFNKHINTPIEEDIFKIKWIDAEDFFKYKYHSNILIVSLENPTDKTGDKLFDKFSELFGNENIFTNFNLFSENQLILF